MKKSEEKAYSFRDKNNISDFPLTFEGLKKILLEMGIEVCVYSESMDKLKVLGWTEAAPTNKALTGKVNGTLHIFMDDAIENPTEKLWVLTHEVAHIACGSVYHKERSDEMEDEANEFVDYFLAPPCYLDSLCVKTLADVQEIMQCEEKYCKTIFANLICFQQREIKELDYLEQKICLLMGRNRPDLKVEDEDAQTEIPAVSVPEEPKPATETKSEPESIPEVKEEPKPTPEPTPESAPKSNRYYHESTPSSPPRVEKQVEIRYIPQPISTPAPQIDKKQQKILAGMGALLIVLLCVLCVFIGRSSTTSNTPQPVGQGYYIIQQPQDISGSAANPPAPQSTPQAPASISASESESSSAPSSTSTPESSAPTQSDGRIVSSVDGEGTLVYVTTTGSKYHKWGCQYINGKTNLIDMYISEAQDKGYQPCEVCFGK